MSFTALTCPACGTDVKQYRNPLPTVDIIIEVPGGIVLIERKNPPHGWALPGGFVDYGESLEEAARREAKEETTLTITDLTLLGCYSDPARDFRMHCISTVYIASSIEVPVAGDDAANVQIFPVGNLPTPLCFDHGQILADYQGFRSTHPIVGIKRSGKKP